MVARLACKLEALIILYINTSTIPPFSTAITEQRNKALPLAHAQTIHYDISNARAPISLFSFTIGLVDRVAGQLEALKIIYI